MSLPSESENPEMRCFGIFQKQIDKFKTHIVLWVKIIWDRNDKNEDTETSMVRQINGRNSVIVQANQLGLIGFKQTKATGVGKYVATGHAPPSPLFQS